MDFLFLQNIYLLHFFYIHSIYLNVVIYNVKMLRKQIFYEGERYGTHEPQTTE